LVNGTSLPHVTVFIAEQREATLSYCTKPFRCILDTPYKYSLFLWGIEALFVRLRYEFFFDEAAGIVATEKFTCLRVGQDGDSERNAGQKPAPVHCDKI